MTPASVMMVTAEYPPHSTGGLGTHVASLTRACADRGVSVHVIAPGYGRDVAIAKTETWEADGGVIHRVAPSEWTLAGPWFGLERGKRYLDDVHAYALSLGTRPDVVHCHDFHLFGAARAIARATGAKLVLTVHLLHHPTFAHWGQRLSKVIVDHEAEACRGADVVITVSHAMRELIIETHGLPPDRVHAIHNGVDAEPHAAIDLNALRAEIAPPEAKILLFAGRMTAQKGVLPLLRSAALVVREQPNVRYALVGPTGEPVPTRRDTAAEMAALLAGDPTLRDRVLCVGSVPRQRLLDLYRVADIVVVPSVYEPFGYVAVEAMMAGLPVVASAVGGLAEIVVPNVTGLVCPVRPMPDGTREVDVESLAALQLELLRDPGRGRRMGEAGKARALEEFSVERMAARTLDVYRIRST